MERAAPPRTRLFLEALGVFFLYMLFANGMMPLFAPMGLGGILLFWLSYAAFGALVAYIVRRSTSGWTFRDLGFKTDRGWRKDIGLGFLIYCAVYILEIPFINALLPVSAEQLASQLSFTQEMTLPTAMGILLLMAIVIGFITGALHEEIRFRGYLQGIFIKNGYPSLGLFISLIPFAFGHYFSHAEWDILQVLRTVPTGFAFCLGFYMTGSLLVPITTHVLANTVPVFAPFLYSRGYETPAHLLTYGIAILFVVLLLVNRGSLKRMWLGIREMVVVPGWRAASAGLTLGAAFLLLVALPGILRTRFTLGDPAYFGILVGGAAVCLLASSLFNAGRKREEMEQNTAVSSL